MPANDDQLFQTSHGPYGRVGKMPSIRRHFKPETAIRRARPFLHGTEDSLTRD